MTPAASKPRAKRGEGLKTTYVILSALGDMSVPLFKAVDDIEATSATSAIREHMRRSGGTTGWKSVEAVLFVAVPKRSWQVIKAQVERTERLIVGPWKPNGAVEQHAEDLKVSGGATPMGRQSPPLISSIEVHANVEDDIPF